MFGLSFHHEDCYNNHVLFFIRISDGIQQSDISVCISAGCSGSLFSRPLPVPQLCTSGCKPVFLWLGRTRLCPCHDLFNSVQLDLRPDDQSYRDKDRKTTRQYLTICIVLNLLLLGFFKYYDFFIGNLNAIGITFLKPLKLGLPIGISFYTFQAMSYPIDLYRHDTDPQRSVINFGAYVTMFPQLIAGPIVRYRDIADMLEHRKENADKFYEGVIRFMCGLAKKVLLANSCGQVFETVNSLAFSQSSVLTAWLGILCYAFQIYFDFSGYSDMAIGLGKMFGFDFLENFNYPYIARSITDFWRRWHMSLSYWFRDYVYIPLGGNRHGLKRQIINIMIVWLLTGFWHGASWNFVLWGVFYGIILIIEKLFLLKPLQKVPAVVGHIYTMFVVLVAWVLFAFTDFSQVLTYLGMMFGTSASGSCELSDRAA